jgi:hypothetical protein
MDQYRFDLETELKQSPINDAAILSSVGKVISRHKKHLEKSQRRNRFRAGYVTLLFIGLIAIVITVTPLWETIFHAKTAATSELPLVEGDGIRIMPEEFLLYKSGVDLSNQQPGVSKMNVTDAQIVDNLITEPLTVQYAKKLGLTVSSEEIDKEIAFQRNSLIQAPKDNPIKELMVKRIKLNGLTEDEFWGSELVRTKYENTILVGKMFTKLVADGTFKKQSDGSEFTKFKEELLHANKDKLSINWSTIVGD